MHNELDVVVIGGGPAGCAAAMILARSKWKVLVIDRGTSQSYLGSLPNVSCFPGFPESIRGDELLKRIRKQAELEGVRFASDTVTALAADTKPIRVMTDGSGEFNCKTAIIATGAAQRTNFLHGEKEFLGRGVSHDAISDGPSVAKRVTAVVGRNKRAADAAIYLSRFVEKIFFIIPSNKLDVSQNVLDKLQSSKHIEMLYSTSLKRINGSGNVSSITVLSSGQEREIQVTGVFSYVHDYQPTTVFLGNQIELSSSGAVKVDQNMATTAEGIFACGDVLCARPQFPAIASAQGVLAGMNADNYMAGL